jgi:DNA uptake protein ComE-like DNA-binding protein
MKRLIVTSIALLALCGCTPNSKTPDQIRSDAANATATASQDVKAVAQGVSDGLKSTKTIHINSASESDLETLPGVDATSATRIINGRPYNATNDLVDRHIVSQAEYDRLAGHIDAQ